MPKESRLSMSEYVHETIDSVIRATDEEVHQIIDLLQTRGIEGSSEQVRIWLERMNNICMKQYGKMVGEGHFVRLALEDAKTVTMCLHLHFGDAK